MSHEDVKCRCDLMPRTRYVLFPHALASHVFSTIKSSLTFKSAPDMERTVGKYYHHFNDTFYLTLILFFVFYTLCAEHFAMSCLHGVIEMILLFNG